MTGGGYNLSERHFMCRNFSMLNLDGVIKLITAQN
jgi:hypothetical protein